MDDNMTYMMMMIYDHIFDLIYLWIVYYVMLGWFTWVYLERLFLFIVYNNKWIVIKNNMYSYSYYYLFLFIVIYIYR